MTEQTHAQDEVARLLRDRIDAATAVLDRDPPDPSHMRALGRRRRQRRLVAQSVAAMIAAGGATALIVTATANLTRHGAPAVGVKPSPSPTPVTLTVPWTADRYAPPVKEPIARPDPALAPSSRRCTPEDLQLTGSVVSPDGTGPDGAVMIRVLAKNASAQPCELLNTVPVRIVTANGELLRTDGASDLVARAPLPALLPGDSATTTVRWVSWCGPPVQDWTLELSLSQPTYQFIPVHLAAYPAQPNCQYHQSAIGGGLWVVLNSYGQPRARPLAALQARIEQSKLSSRAGSTFRFSVLVTNPTLGPITLVRRPCPYYATGMNSDKHPGIQSLAGTIYYLNCAQLPPLLGPGQSMRLLMRMRVPLSDDMFGPNKPGGYEFYWNVPDWGVATPHVRLNLR